MAEIEQMAALCMKDLDDDDIDDGDLNDEDLLVTHLHYFYFFISLICHCHETIKYENIVSVPVFFIC